MGQGEKALEHFDPCFGVSYGQQGKHDSHAKGQSDQDQPNQSQAHMEIDLPIVDLDRYVKSLVRFLGCHWILHIDLQITFEAR